MFQPHPNLSKEINDSIAESEIAGGVWFDKPEWATSVEGTSLPEGSTVHVRTRNTLYLIEKRPDGTYISGNARFCPTPTKCSVHGSTWGGSMLKVGWIGVGMRLEFSVEGDGRTVTTSEIQDVRVGPKEKET
jgi:hypothetical protein